MGQVLIRNLDDDTIAAYREAAVLNQRSLEAELRSVLTAWRPVASARKAEAMERLAMIRERTRDTPQTPAEMIVREIRDA